MTCDELQRYADLIRERTGAPRVRIVLDYGDGHSLTIESDAQTPAIPTPDGERVECFDQSPWAR